MDSELGVDAESILHHAMNTEKNKHKSQDLHADYDYKVLVKDYGRNIHRKHGQSILFGPDLVHTSRHIEAHFFLATKFQVANPEAINY